MYFVSGILEFVLKGIEPNKTMNYDYDADAHLHNEVTREKDEG